MLQAAKSRTDSLTAPIVHRESDFICSYASSAPQAFREDTQWMPAIG